MWAARPDHHKENLQLFSLRLVVIAAASILILPFEEQSALTHEHPQNMLDFRSLLSLMSLLMSFSYLGLVGLVSKMVRGLFVSIRYDQSILISRVVFPLYSHKIMAISQ